MLDIGAGYGYSTAILARLAEAVVAVEEDEAFAGEAEAALSDTGSDNAAVVTGPLNEGAAKHGPYDVVVVQGAVEEIPAAILDQVKDGGRIAALFMDGALGVCRVGYLVDGSVTWRFAFNASAPVLPGFEKQRDFAL